LRRYNPVLGNLIYSPLGDFIDALSIACTTFGVCTTLGFGVSSINYGFHRLNDEIGVTTDNQISIIWVITVIATVSISLGLKKGIQTLATITFGIGLFLLFALMFLDNTWFLLNSYVQSLGHYWQWVIQVGFQTDTWQQLAFEFQDKADENLAWGSDGTTLYDNMVRANALTDAAIAGTTEGRGLILLPLPLLPFLLLFLLLHPLYSSPSPFSSYSYSSSSSSSSYSTTLYEP